MTKDQKKLPSVASAKIAQNAVEFLQIKQLCEDEVFVKMPGFSFFTQKYRQPRIAINN